MDLNSTVNTTITTKAATTNENENQVDEKFGLSRNELIKSLCCLEGKLQASEIAIAALQSDRLKRLFYPPIIKRPPNVNKKTKRNSINYETIIATNRARNREETNLNENLETVLNTNLDEECDKFAENSDLNLEDLNKEFEDNEDIKNDSLFPNDRYNEYRKNLEKNPYLTLATDLKYAVDFELNESFIAKVYNSRVMGLKQLIMTLQNTRKFFEDQLDELSTRYKNVVDELEVEKEKNIRFKRDDTVKKLEKCEQEKKELEDELNNLKKEYDAEKEREKTMICYLLSERKQLIIRLIEESEKNTELVNLLSTEKDRSAEMEEGLEDESKRSLQMEIDLECLTLKYEHEKRKLDKRVQELESECDKLKQKISELMNSNNTNNNNPITTNKNLPDLGEGVRSTIVNFNNAIAAKPSLAAKPSFDSISNATNGKQTVTIINTQPVRSNSVQSKSSISRVGNNVNSNVITTTTSTSVASVIQKFSNNSISNSTTTTQHPPIIKKLSSSGLVANIAQSISNTVSNSRPPPPPPPKPSVNPQLLKERTAKLLEQQQATSKNDSIDTLTGVQTISSEIDLIREINSNLDRLSRTSISEACSKSDQNFDRNVSKLEASLPDFDNAFKDNAEKLPVNFESDRMNEKLSSQSRNRKISSQKKFSRANALKSQNSK